MAHYFWNECRNPLLTALIGAWIAKRLGDSFQNKFKEELVNSYAKLAWYIKQKKDSMCRLIYFFSDFEQIAVGVLGCVYASDQLLAMKIVKSHRRLQYVNSCLEIAGFSSAEV